MSAAPRSRERSVLVVDDSALMRAIVRDCVVATPGFRLAGEARHGLEALEMVHALQPDIVTLDIHMPTLDGLQTLGYIMSEAPRPVIVLSALAASTGGAMAIRALELGAVEFVPKPSAVGDAALPELRERLATALAAAAAADVETAVRRVGLLARPHAASVLRGERPSPSGEWPRFLGASASPLATSPTDRVPSVVAVASSTGGPRALAEIVPRLPAGFDAAVLIAQHIPAGFSAGLAVRLDGMSALPVREAVHGEPIVAGRVYLAPGGRHLRVRLEGEALVAVLDDGPAMWGVRPSADVLFASVAETCGAAAVGVVLTGMGRDGAEGLRAMRERGAASIVQDRETSIVPGMPEAARRTAGADRVAALRDVAAAIVDCLAVRRIVS